MGDACDWSRCDGRCNLAKLVAELRPEQEAARMLDMRRAQQASDQKAFMAKFIGDST